MIKSRKPDISVVIVTRNRKHHLHACLKALLANVTIPREIIVIDDGDDDQLRPEVSRYRVRQHTSIRYHKLQFSPCGISAARNKGITLARGSIVAFTDDDCVVAEDWVAALWKSSERFQNAGAVTGLIHPRDEGNYWHQVMGIFHQDKALIPKKTHMLYGANFYIRKSLFIRNNISFMSQLDCSDDRYIEHMLRMKKLPMYYDPTFVVWHDFRRDTISVIKQWIHYGKSDFRFWMLENSFNSRDAGYFRTQRRAVILFQLPVRICMRIFQQINGLGLRTVPMSLYAGLCMLYVMYYVGVYTAYFQWNNDTVKKSAYVKNDLQ